MGTWPCPDELGGKLGTPISSLHLSFQPKACPVRFWIEAEHVWSINSIMEELVQVPCPESQFTLLRDQKEMIVVGIPEKMCVSGTQQVFRTGTPHLIVLCSIMLHKCFWQIEGLWWPFDEQVWEWKNVSTIFPAALANFVSLCHIVIILTIFWTFSLSLHLENTVWSVILGVTTAVVLWCHAPHHIRRRP